MTAAYAIACKTGWTIETINALPRSEFLHYLTLSG